MVVMIIWTETQTSVKGHEASVDEEVSLRLGDWCTSCFTKATYTRQSLGNDEYIDAVTVPHVYTKHSSQYYTHDDNHCNVLESHICKQETWCEQFVNSVVDAVVIPINNQTVSTEQEFSCSVYQCYFSIIGMLLHFEFFNIIKLKFS